MGLTIRFQGGPRAGAVEQFDDSVERITLGRDPARCQVVFPADDTQVGREHCVLEREAGRYRLILNQDNLVLVDGRPAVDGQELGPAVDVQIGPAGPKLVIETGHDKGLPSTAYQGKRPGQPTLIRSAAETAATGRRVATAAVVLLALAGVVGYLAWHRHDVDVKQTRQELASTQSQVALIVPHVSALDKLTDEQKTILANVATEVAGVEKKLKDLEPRLAQKVTAASPSVYLVMVRDRDGQEYAAATAWVADKEKGIMATNGHVAELFPAPASGGKLVVRSNTTPTKTYVVKSAVTHPGYAQFQRFWGTYDPTQRRNQISAESIEAAGPACDVALLYLENYEGLANALPIAPAEVLKSLGPGYAVGYVGYPMEGMVLGGVNAAAPTPTRHLAYISSMTSYFGDSNVDDSERLLLQHALPCAGGASGSPIINRDGQVVAVLNAGNVIGMTPRGRIGSSVNIAFGQRSDLVRELLEKSADQKQIGRLARWQADIGKYFKRRNVVENEIKLVRDRMATGTIADWQQQQTGLGNYTVENLTLFDSVLPARKGAQAKVTLAATGPCFVMAYDTSGTEATYLTITQKDGATETLLGGLTTDYRWAKFQKFDGHDKAGLTIAVETDGESGAKIAVRAVQAKRTRVESKDRLNKVLDAWRDEVTKSAGHKMKASVVSETSGTLPEPLSEGQPAINKVELTLKDAGDYFAFISTPGDDKMVLLVAAKLGFGLEQLMAYQHDTPTAFGSFHVGANSNVVAFIAGAARGVPYEFKLYRAVEESK